MRRSAAAPRLLFAVAVLSTSAALGKSWKGIDPGQSSRLDIIARFGPPSRQMTEGGKEVFAYFEKEAIDGTSQVQFRVDVKTHTVERIDVFPNVDIDWDNVAGSYGPSCKKALAPDEPCHFVRETKEGRAYFEYPQLGLQVLFNQKDLVEVMIFTAPKPQAKAKAPPKKTQK